MFGIKITLKNGESYQGWYAVEEGNVYMLDTKEGSKSFDVRDIQSGFQYAYGRYSMIFEDGKRAIGDSAEWREIGEKKIM